MLKTTNSIKEKIIFDEPMKKHTSFKIGGTADEFVKVTNEEELKKAIEYAKGKELPITIIGNGSNLLVQDKGIRGLVIKIDLQKFQIEKKENYAEIIVGSGYKTMALAVKLMNAEISGFEELSGIPGTIGGAVFMNAGAYVTGSQLKRLGEYYAKAIHDKYGDDFDVLFGPAYKGIPISVVTAIAYSELYGKEIRYCSDRKEEKDHGADKGSFLGSKLQDGDRVVMIEDVTTSGKSMEETVPKVRGAANVEIVGLMVSLDRMEIGKGGQKCALEEVKELYGFETNAIVTMAEVVEHLYNRECNGKVVIDDKLKAAIDAYYEQYGAK